MIGALLFLNSRGDIIVSRSFRDGFGIRVMADVFRDELLTTKLVDRCPINMIDKTCFLHMRYENLYIVAACNTNVNCYAVFQYMTRFLQICREYYGRVDESSLQEHFLAIYEILDETLDFGLPQITESDLLKSFIGESGAKTSVLKRAKDAEKITVKATGKIPWRGDGIVYRDNEVFLDVVEEVNMLLSQTGQVLQKEVSGVIVVKGFLSGMPECQLRLNDQNLTSSGALGGGASNGDGGSVYAINGEDAVQGPAPVTSASSGAADGATSNVRLDDVTFHQCVRLSTYDTDGTISFVPPDGEFVLMRYRTSHNINSPFRLNLTRVKEISKLRFEIDFRLKSEFDPTVHATAVTVKIPCPENTAQVTVRTTQGKAKYDPSVGGIVWKIKRMQGGSEYDFSAEVNLIASTLQSDRTTWSQPPISIGFTAEMFSASGLRVQFLKITESKLNYKATKWVRYKSVGGQYQCRV